MTSYREPQAAEGETASGFRTPGREGTGPAPCAGPQAFRRLRDAPAGAATGKASGRTDPAARHSHARHLAVMPSRAGPRPASGATRPAWPSNPSGCEGMSGQLPSAEILLPTHRLRAGLGADDGVRPAILASESGLPGRQAASELPRVVAADAGAEPVCRGARHRHCREYQSPEHTSNYNPQAWAVRQPSISDQQVSVRV
jgi:hypothetical protein